MAAPLGSLRFHANSNQRSWLSAIFDHQTASEFDLPALVQDRIIRVRRCEGGPGRWLTTTSAGIKKALDSTHEKTQQDFELPRPRNRQAYVFYATSHAYAIAVLVLVRLLQRLGMRDDADLLVLHLPLPSHVLTKMREMGIVTRLVPELRYIDHPYFRDCLVKLRIFHLIEYDRVVFVEADTMPLKSLDDLLDFTFDGPVAAPSAYWIPQPCWTSALLVVRPSAAAWSRVSRRFSAAAAKQFYDMDIVNAEFGAEIQTLPSGCFCLNSEWEDVDRPGFFGDFVDTYSKASIVHFTALGKPWSYSLDSVRRLRPNAHPVFYEMWETWRNTRDEIFVRGGRHATNG